MNHNKCPYQSMGTYDGESYIERDADELLYKEISNNRYYLYILACRQSGKSSLIAHTIKKINKNKFLPIFIDFSEFSQTELENYDSFLLTFIKKINSFFNDDFDFIKQEKQNPNEFVQFSLEKILSLTDRRILVFLDEIDKLITLNYKEYFFSLIRSFFNKRTNSNKFDYYRIQFILSGASRVEELITNPNISPFNVGKEIVLNNLRENEIKIMSSFLSKDKIKNGFNLEKYIYNYTNGSIYLTQSIFENIWDMVNSNLYVIIDDSLVDKAVENITHQARNNIHFYSMYSKVLNDSKIYIGFQNLINGSEVDVKILDILKMIGIIGDNKTYQNEIYKKIFGKEGILSLEKDAEKMTNSPYLAEVKTGASQICNEYKCLWIKKDK